MIFAFAGASGAWPGMGRGLYASEPVFRATVDACDRIAHGVSEWFAADEPDSQGEHHLAPTIPHGVLQLALCDLWADAGVQPDAVLSLGSGEIAAAYCAGALSREEAVTVLCAASRMTARHPCAGQLLTVTADLTAARDLCHNAPRRLDFVGTLSSDEALLYTADEDAGENAAHVQAAGRLVERPPTAYACHTMRSPYELDVLEAELAHLAPRRPRLPLYSAVAGRDIAPDGVFDALHWHWMLGHAFHFAEATVAALGSDAHLVVNVGAAPVATRWMLASARHVGIEPRIVDSMHPGDDENAWRAAVKPRRGTRPEAGANVPEADPATMFGPVSYFAQLRSSAPVHQVRDDVWLVVAHKEIREAFTRPDIFSSGLHQLATLDSLGLDPPEHTAARRALAPLFSPDALTELAELADRTCDELLLARAGAAEVDVVSDLTAPLGEQIAAHLLGFDDEQLAHMRHAAGPTERDGRDVLAASATALATIRPDGGGADLLLWLGATLNTKRAITAAVLLLLADAELRARVERDPGEIGALVEEAMRLHPPEMMPARLATQDTTLGGVAIPGGAKVLLCVAAANRDPAHFEDPDRVRLDRRVTHLSFGVGLHRCIGTKLARIEADAALRALFEHRPGFRSVQPTCALRWIRSFGTHGLEQLLIA